MQSIRYLQTGVTVIAGNAILEIISKKLWSTGATFVYHTRNESLLPAIYGYFVWLNELYILPSTGTELNTIKAK